MLCQNQDHDSDPPEAVAVITLPALSRHEQQGYAVCPPHLIDYIQGVYIDRTSNQVRLAFTVEPTP